MFQSVPQNVSFPKLEEEVLAFWKAGGIYEKSLAQRAGCEKFVFYEGPPTANGMPHPGHCLTRAIKDLFPRYRTMRGYLCERKAGWDTHGLPVEVEVCKELGIHSKDEIEAFGVEPFIHKCQESVWRYMQEWERLTERLGFWIKLDEAYVTYHQSYVESVWWSLKNLFDRGLLYQGHKIVWWWAQGGTALSAGEVGQGYREVADPSVYVRFPLVDEPNTSLLVWTTTPWTLPSNQFAAVHPEIMYVTLLDVESGEKLIVAESLAETIAAKVKRELRVESESHRPGTALYGKRYIPPFDFYYAEAGESKGALAQSAFGKAGRLVQYRDYCKLPADAIDAEMAKTDEYLSWRVVLAPFVTVDSGTGIVHLAPAFGEVDYDRLFREQVLFEPDQRPSLINSVGPDGKFTADAPDYQGRWVKDCDKDITRNLRERGLLFHFEQYVHDYPFCWRADQDPLIQYPRESWFIKTTEFKDQMLANNEQINWLPEHIKHGRFGNFLESNVDWALSRERYWGTPLPIWVCEQTGQMEAVGSYEELLSKPGIKGTEVWDEAKKGNPKLVDDLKVHKPYIDSVTYDSPFAQGARMKRVTEVIDCWYDSGAMPFAQWGYPHTGKDKFADQFPADFISEAIDQTRGWFYSQLAISTLLFSGDNASPNQQSAISNHKYPHPFRNCIVLGLMLGEDGQKMSKSKRNYREPNEIFNKYGADALRWFFFANQPPWSSIRYKEQAIKDSIPEFLLRLWNVYSFFVIYANIDGFDPSERLSDEGGQLTSGELAKAKGYRPVKERGELDRWVLSELNRTAAAVVERMDAYDNYVACARLVEFVDALSNWYVRRSRDRFWSDEKESPEKLDAYWTLYECLLATSKLIAPFTPFLAEGLWRNLAGVFGSRAVESVHLCDYPIGDERIVDAVLSRRMGTLRSIASQGRVARSLVKLSVRYPLRAATVVVSFPDDVDWLCEHDDLLRDELNVKSIRITTNASEIVDYEVKPNFKALGPTLGKWLPLLQAEMKRRDHNELVAQLHSSGSLTISATMLVGRQETKDIVLQQADVEVQIKARKGQIAGESKGIVFSITLPDPADTELVYEGYAREIVRFIQERRKDLQCEYIDRIEVGFATESRELESALLQNAGYICKETLAVRFVAESISEAVGIAHELGANKVTLYVKIANPLLH